MVAVLMFLVVCGILILGYPVAISLAGTALLFASIGILHGSFDEAILLAFPIRVYAIMTNSTLLAVPLFIFMGVMLEKSKIAEQLLETMSELFGSLRGGMGLAVTLVGMLMAASTGIVGATVVTMGVLSLPTMLKRGYNVSLAAGTICATGTLGQIIPPSIALVLLGDVLSNAYQQAQLAQGSFSPKTISVGDLFAASILPGLCLVVLYLGYILLISTLRPDWAPPLTKEEKAERGGLVRRVLLAMLPPLVLILAVLGSILSGSATPTEAAGVGAFGALVLAGVRGTLTKSGLQQVGEETTKVTSMVFFILIGATAFSLVFRGFEGDELIREAFETSSYGPGTLLFITMVVVFVLGFLLDFIEITFVVVPIVGPILLAQPEIDPVWLGVMLAMNLQTSFLTPPFGFSLFYLRGVAPPSVRTSDIYRGVVPFIGMQLSMLVILWFWPQLATWLPQAIYAK
ncbi:MAG: TRAP transporter large permease subunit [Myxococcales bacterium]|nr:TRAP transporter large permease subunit [Myxococcales bacterium]